MDAADPPGSRHDPSICWSCRGSGFCDRCKGNGRYQVRGLDRWFDCRDCAGSGECAECDGTGRIVPEDEDNES